MDGTGMMTGQYTLDSSMNDILSDERISQYFSLFYPQEFVDMLNDEQKDMPLARLKEEVKMPWGLEYTSDLALSIAMFSEFMLEGIYNFVSLWTEDEGMIPVPGSSGKDSAWLLADQRDYKSKRGAAIILPGGGYVNLSMGIEGFAYAEAMKDRGYKPFILSYRLLPNQYPTAQQDLMLAIKYIRANAVRYNIDPDDILIMGSSAGGHVCATEAALYKELEEDLMNELEKDQPELGKRYTGISSRPDKVGLCYAAINYLRPNVYERSLFMVGQDADKVEKIAAHRQVRADYPPTYIWMCRDDAQVPADDGRLMAGALEEWNVPHKFHMYPTGGHGIGLAEGTSAAGWIDEMVEYLQK